MKRFFGTLAAACAVTAALAAGSATAGGLPVLGGGSPSASNETGQQNDASAVNVPILSGNNVAVLSGGDQSSSAGVDQEQTNVDATEQDGSGSEADSRNCCSDPPGEAASNETGQQNEASAANVPILSGNNVAVLSGGEQSSSAGVDQEQTNVNLTKQQDGSGRSDSRCKHDKHDDESSGSDNSTRQTNQASAVNVPIASGNNVALLSTGEQTSSAGVDQEQTNLNLTRQ